MEFPNFDPVLIQIGPLAIRWYALAYVAGILPGWRYAVGLVRNARLWGAAPPPANAEQVDDLILGEPELAEQRRKKKSPDLRICRSFYLRSRAAHVVKVVSTEDVARFQRFAVEHRFPSLQLMFLLALLEGARSRLDAVLAR